MIKANVNELTNQRPTEGFVLRSDDFGKNEEQKILALFSVCFGHERKMAYWNWRYRENPFHKPVIIRAEDPSTNALIGHQAITPVKLNCRGTETLAGQSGDTMVHPSSRQLGIFKSALLASHQKSEEAGFSFVYGFPGPMSLPGFIQKCGWLRICYMQRYTKALDFSQKLKRLVRFSLLSGLLNQFVKVFLIVQVRWTLFINKKRMYDLASYESASSLPHDYNTLWDQIKRNEVFSIWKDQKYLHWRYEKHPVNEYRFHCLRQGQKPVAFAVTRTVGKAEVILEFLVYGKQLQWAKYLIAELQLAAQKKGATELSFIGHDDGFFQEAFEGFIRRQDHDQVFCLFPLEKGPSLSGVELRSNWTVTHGDWDGV